jgi:hypothetical protein
VNNEQLFRTNPREFALKLAEDGIVSHEQLCLALLCRMSCDDVRDALDANELSPRFSEESEELAEIADYLGLIGPAFTGDDAQAMAYDWVDHDFSTGEVREWCVVGVWDPATAAEFRAAEVTPEEIAGAADVIDHSGHASSVGAINAACNGDLDPQILIEWARRLRG